MPQDHGSRWIVAGKRDHAVTGRGLREEAQRARRGKFAHLLDVGESDDLERSSGVQVWGEERDEEGVADPLQLHDRFSGLGFRQVGAQAEVLATHLEEGEASIRKPLPMRASRTKEREQ